MANARKQTEKETETKAEAEAVSDLIEQEPGKGRSKAENVVNGLPPVHPSITEVAQLQIGPYVVLFNCQGMDGIPDISEFFQNEPQADGADMSLAEYSARQDLIGQLAKVSRETAKALGAKQEIDYPMDRHDFGQAQFKSDLRDYYRGVHETLARRAAAIQRVQDADIPAAVKSVMVDRAPVDQAMRRVNSRGAQRPSRPVREIPT